MPVVSVSSGTPNPQIEGSSNKIKFTLTLSEAATQDVTVRYSTIDDTAKAGSDFKGFTSKTVTFLAGQTSKTISVTLLDDTLLENPESFSFQIDSATNATVSTTKKTAIGNIVDDDMTASVVRIYDTTQYKTGDPSGYGSGDPSGLAYVPGINGAPGTLFIADSEHDESPYYSSANLLGLVDDGSYYWSSLRGFTREPTGLAYNPFNSCLYITDDDKQEVFWVNPANPSVRIGQFDTAVLGFKDTEDPKFDPVTGNMFVLDGSLRKLCELTANGQLVRSTSLPSLMTDAEALAYSHTTNDGHRVFFVASGASPNIYQMDDTGKILAATDVLASYTNPITGVKPKLKGMELAPSSDPFDGDKMSLYVADYGVDQKNDGRVFEIDLSTSTGWYSTTWNTSTSWMLV